MDLALDQLLSLEDARSLGEELVGATDEVLQANRPRLLELEDAIVQCEALLQRVGHAQIVYVRAFLKTGAWRMHGMRTAADWVAWRLGLDRRTASDRVRVATALEGLPKTEAAFAAGAINYTKARAVSRVATRDDEAYWLERADLVSSDQLDLECRETPGPRGSEEGPVRWITSRTRPDGLVQTTIVHPPEESALFFKSLDAAIVIAHGSRKGPGSSEPSAGSEGGSDEPADSQGGGSDEPADSEGGGSDEPADSQGGGSDEPRFGRADALLAVSNYFLASQPSPASSPGRYEVQVRVDAELLLETDRPVCELVDGTPLDPETVRRLSCDAAKLLYRTDEADVPLEVGRRTRTIPAALKRALILRDGARCRFPGCCAHLFVEAHHLKHWADGGPTCLDNLILLCSRHHSWAHEGGGRVSADEEGCVVFSNAFGEPLPEVPTIAAA